VTARGRRLAPPAAARRNAPGEVRIIGGAYRGRRLPVADRPGLRPTPDRVRETLFNWLGQRLDGWRVLDAFAGSGALGFEAASRGAAAVLLLESDAEVAARLQASRDRLGAAAVRVQRADALAWMRSAATGTFDLVLLDPPFDAGMAGPALAAAVPLVGERGFVYLETPAGGLPPAPPGFEVWREGRAGAVGFALLRRGYTAAVDEARSAP
jgi:16S rRNA (guanine(966)-N(2))-methyltransferase RsmD